MRTHTLTMTDRLRLKQRLNLFFEDFHSLRESLRAIQERMHAIRDQQEGEQQDQNIPPGWLEPILAANQQTEIIELPMIIANTEYRTRLDGPPGSRS